MKILIPALMLALALPLQAQESEDIAHIRSNVVIEQGASLEDEGEVGAIAFAPRFTSSLPALDPALYHVSWATIDLDGSGSVSKAEVQAHSVAHASGANLWREFNVVDTNNDGRLDRTELKDWLVDDVD